MFRGITVSRRDDELIAVKRIDPDDPGRRRGEAEILARLDHPGVVRFVALVDGEPAELQTRYIGTDTWSRSPPTNPEELIAGLVVVSETVADLHTLDICHGAVHADHVVIGSDRRPILCGFADARPFDPDAEQMDMVGLAGLLRDSARSLPDRVRGEIEELARRATSGEISARVLSNELAALSPGPTSDTARRPLGRRITGPAPIAATLALVVVAAVVLAVRPGGTSTVDTGPVTSSPETSSPATSAPETGSVPPATTPVSLTPPPTTTAAVAAPSAEPAIRFTHGGRHYGVGAHGDIAILGDWNCDGVRTPALLQISEATVAVFDEWPDPESVVHPSATGPAPGATGLEAVEHEGCDRLRILEPAGSRLFTPEA